MLETQMEGEVETRMILGFRDQGLGVRGIA